MSKFSFLSKTHSSSEPYHLQDRALQHLMDVDSRQRLSSVSHVRVSTDRPTTSSQQVRSSRIFCCWSDDLELTAWPPAGPDTHLVTFRSALKTLYFVSHIPGHVTRSALGTSCDVLLGLTWPDSANSLQLKVWSVYTGVVVCDQARLLQCSVLSWAPISTVMTSFWYLRTVRC